MFSRALLGRYASPQFSRCSAHKSPEPILRPNSRFFSCLNRLQAPKKKRAPSSVKTSKPPKPSSTLPRPLREPSSLPLREPPPGTQSRLARFEHFVSKHNGSVVLFKAPSHKGYIFSAYSVAAFCYAYAGFNFYTTSIDPLVAPKVWQQALFGGICIVMAGMGTVFFLRASKLVASVTAIRSQGETRLDLKVRRMVPFLKPLEYSIHPSQLSCSRQIVVPPKNPNRTATDTQQEIESQQAVAQTSFLRSPFKKISFSMWKVFINARRLFSQEHFVHLKIDGQRGTFRMDTTGDVSEGFFLLNNLVREGYS